MCRSCGRSSQEKDKVHRSEGNHRQFAGDFCRNFDVFRQGNCMTADDARKKYLKTASNKPATATERVR